MGNNWGLFIGVKKASSSCRFHGRCLFLRTSGAGKQRELFQRHLLSLPGLLPKPQEMCPCAVVLDMPIGPAGPDEADEGNVPWMVTCMPTELCDSSTWVPIML